MRDVLDGMRYLSVRPVLLASFVVDIIAMVAGMPRALFPEMAERTFGDPPGGGIALGWLFAAIPVGAVICGLLSGWLSRISRQGIAVVVAVCAWGIAVAAFGLTHSLWLAALFLGLAGAADMVSSVFRNSILLTAATDEMRGRMQGVFTIVVTGGPRIADTLHGVLGAAIGTKATVAGGGILVVVLVLIAAALLPAFRAYRAPKPGETAVVDAPAT
jgi:MFS family permease